MVGVMVAGILAWGDHGPVSVQTAIRFSRWGMIFDLGSDFVGLLLMLSAIAFLLRFRSMLGKVIEWKEGQPPL
jgi:hypothetical protein